MGVVVTENPPNVATSKNHHHGKGHDYYSLWRVYRCVLTGEDKNHDRAAGNDENQGEKPHQPIVFGSLALKCAQRD